MMRWLTIERIKAQCRIEPDFNDEDELLEEYGEEAEETVLNVINRSYENLMEQYGKVPTPLRRASLMLVDLAYKQRSPISSQNMYLVPYTFDILIKPYVRLADNDINNNTQYGCKNL